MKTPNGGKLSQSFGITYADDCFTMRVGVARTFYRDRDVKPGTAVMVSLIFKNLGQFGHKFNLNREGPGGVKQKGAFDI